MTAAQRATLEIVASAALEEKPYPMSDQLSARYDARTARWSW